MKRQKAPPGRGMLPVKALRPDMIGDRARHQAGQGTAVPRPRPNAGGRNGQGGDRKEEHGRGIEFPVAQPSPRDDAAQGVLPGRPQNPGGGGQAEPGPGHDDERATPQHACPFPPSLDFQERVGADDEEKPGPRETPAHRLDRADGIGRPAGPELDGAGRPIASAGHGPEELELLQYMILAYLSAGKTEDARSMPQLAR